MNARSAGLELCAGPRSRPVLRARLETWDALRFLASAHALADRLPEASAALNLCEHRENFLLAFAAMLIRGQACLLPPSRVPAVVDEVAAEHPGCCRVDDLFVDHVPCSPSAAIVDVPRIPADRVVVIGYTSGSTGRPKPNLKTWGSLAGTTALNAARLRQLLPVGAQDSTPWIVATVPPQHMYGIEMSVLLPLLAGMAIDAGRPLYPADVATALAGVPAPRFLVSTPVHLRALLESGVELPEVRAVVSATAPLPRELATRIEHRFGTVLLEFFGSTETCVIASRRTALDDAWRPHAGIELTPEGEGTRVDAPWFAGPALLADVLDVRGDGTFTVRGRNSDMVEVAGKRASLGDLTRRLAAIPGVVDSVVFQPDDSGSAVARRLAALVVAPGLTEAEVLERLAASVDPAFLPRPLLLVPALPRNEVGKLPRAELLAALKR
jgi:acyl-coenzyme A synthetase/AMP-(fatty) acid ligase